MNLTDSRLSIVKLLQQSALHGFDGPLEGLVLLDNLDAVQLELTSFAHREQSTTVRTIVRQLSVVLPINSHIEAIFRRW